MASVPCLASLAADREYFQPDAGDVFDEFCANVSDSEFDEAAGELAEQMFGDDCDEWTDAQWVEFKRDYGDAITDLLWERA